GFFVFFLAISCLASKNFTLLPIMPILPSLPRLLGYPVLARSGETTRRREDPTQPGSLSPFFHHCLEDLHNVPQPVDSPVLHAADSSAQAARDQPVGRRAGRSSPAEHHDLETQDLDSAEEV